MQKTVATKFQVSTKHLKCILEYFSDTCNVPGFGYKIEEGTRCGRGQRLKNKSKVSPSGVNKVVKFINITYNEGGHVRRKLICNL